MLRIKQNLPAGMSIRRLYSVPKWTGTGTSTGSSTQILVIPVPNTGKVKIFGRSVPVLPKYRNRYYRYR
jgi:hypothetical protein